MVALISTPSESCTASAMRTSKIQRGVAPTFEKGRCHADVLTDVSKTSDGFTVAPRPSVCVSEDVLGARRDEPDDGGEKDVWARLFLTR